MTQASEVPAGELDPFGLTANLAAYEPCEAAERALASLEAALASGAGVSALTGPPGLGKTLALHRLAERASADHHPLYIPYGSLSPFDLCALALGLLERPTTEDPIGALLRYAAEQKARGKPLLLLLDDASCIPKRTAGRLAELVSASEGALRIVVAGLEVDALRDVLAAFGSDVVPVRLAEGLTHEETRRYIERRLALAQVSPETRALFDDQTIAELHRNARGVPRALHTAASALIRDAARGLRDGAPEGDEKPEEEAAVGADLGGTSAVREAEAPRDEPEAAEAADADYGAASPKAQAKAPAQPKHDRDEDDASVASERELSERPFALRVLPLVVTSLAAGAAIFAVVRGLPEKTPDQRGATQERDAPGALQPSATQAGALQPEAAEASRTTPIAGPPEIEETPVAPEPRVATTVVEEPTREPAIGTAASEAAKPTTATIEAEAIVEPEIAPTPVAEQPSAVETRDEGRAPEPIEVEPAPVIATVEPPAPASEPEVSRVEPAPTPQAEAPVQPETKPTPPPVAPAAPVEVFSVSINATPWAIVEVDGRDLGETPLAGVKLTAGPHTFRARMPDGSIREQIVEIDDVNRFVAFD